MRKIENIIDSCNDCRNCVITQEKGGNTFFAAICNHPLVPKGILISNSLNPLDGSKLKIPDNCPLETYQENISN